MALIQMLKRHSLLTYFVLTFGGTWACWIPLALSDAFASQDAAQPSSFLLLWPVGLLIPSLVGILLTAVLATWIIRSESELLKKRLPMHGFSLQMALRQAYNRWIVIHLPFWSTLILAKEQ